MYVFKLCWLTIDFNFCFHCVSTSAFASFIGIPVGIGTSIIRSKICKTTAVIKNYMSIIKKKNYEIVLSAKTKLNTI